MKKSNSNNNLSADSSSPAASMDEENGTSLLHAQFSLPSIKKE